MVAFLNVLSKPEKLRPSRDKIGILVQLLEMKPYYK
jgi:hypothetical protein